MEGCPYDETLTASGGVLPYTWYIVSGALPPGLSLDGATGTISGEPDSVDTFCFTLGVWDDEITTDSQEYCITIHPRVAIKGDANGDCVINILDAVFVVNIIMVCRLQWAYRQLRR